MGAFETTIEKLKAFEARDEWRDEQRETIKNELELYKLRVQRELDPYLAVSFIKANGPLSLLVGDLIVKCTIGVDTNWRDGICEKWFWVEWGSYRDSECVNGGAGPVNDFKESLGEFLAVVVRACNKKQIVKGLT